MTTDRGVREHADELAVLVAATRITTAAADGTRPMTNDQRPVRIQLRRAKGWRKPPGAVVVARPTRWGNPYPVGQYGRTEALRLYREWITDQPELMAAVRSELAGADLACWCPLDQPCHADVLLELANGT